MTADVSSSSSSSSSDARVKHIGCTTSLHWAGEATSQHFYATVHGAYETGLRAALEITQQLQPLSAASFSLTDVSLAPPQAALCHNQNNNSRGGAEEPGKRQWLVPPEALLPYAGYGLRLPAVPLPPPTTTCYGSGHRAACDEAKSEAVRCTLPTDIKVGCVHDALAEQHQHQQQEAGGGSGQDIATDSDGLFLLEAVCV
jgi:hypothetical protein